MKIAIVLGTRPEIIRMAPMIRILERENRDYVLIHSGQHYDYNLDAIFFKELKLPQPRYNLKVGSGSFSEQFSRIIIKLEGVLAKEKPDVVVVEGDTNTVAAGAMTAVRLGIPVAHVEAGCRSFDMNMPEEQNRIIADHVSEVLFPPDKASCENLLREGISRGRIFMEGNILMDSALEAQELSKKISGTRKKLGLKRYAVLTLHRAENTCSKEILESLLKLFESIDIPVVFPMHPRTKAAAEKFKLNSILKRFIVIEPIGYIDNMDLLSNAQMIFTDSGGIQVEASMLGKPCIVLRDTTEWVEELSGGNYVVGKNRQLFLKAYDKGMKHKGSAKKRSKDLGAAKKMLSTLERLHRKGKLKISKKSLV